MTRKIFVGYTCVLAKGATDLQPEFTGKTGTKDEEKIAQQIIDQREAWNQKAAQQPYTGTFGSVYLIDPKLKFAGEFLPKPDLPVERQVVDWLLDKDRYEQAWPFDTHQRYEPTVVFVGFDSRKFLKMLGINCSMPSLNCSVPAPLWYGNTDHRDIEEACIPREFKSTITMDVVLKARRAGLGPRDLKKYDKAVNGWKGPGHNAKQDANIAFALGAQLRLTY